MNRYVGLAGLAGFRSGAQSGGRTGIQICSAPNAQLIRRYAPHLDVVNSHHIMTTSQGVAIVTGGGSGFGAGIARRLAREGTDVVVADIVSRYRDWRVTY
jgi:hypothetical protein